MARGKKPMADTEETPDEQPLPPSTLSTLVRSTEIDLEGMSTEELMGLIEDALALLPAKELKDVRDIAEDKRSDKLEDTKRNLIEEMRARAGELGLSLEELFPHASSGRKQRSDAGQPSKIKYRGPMGEEWAGKGRPPRWLQELEATGRNREEFLVRPEEH